MSPFEKEVFSILRVISGIARGHKLKTLKGMTTRPTSDRVKESLFNILTPYIEDCDILDLFAGTGSLGIEALSRGANSAVFADKDAECCRVIKENLMITGLADKASVYQADFSRALQNFALEGRKFNIILLDPPYKKKLIQDTLKNLTKNDIISSDGILAAEHQRDETLPEQAGVLRLADRRIYGGTAVSFFLKG